MDPNAIAAGWDIMKPLGPDRARTLLEVLELPDDERWAFISRMFVRDDGEWLAEVLADVESGPHREDAGAADRGAARGVGLMGVEPSMRLRPSGY